MQFLQFKKIKLTIFQHKATGVSYEKDFFKYYSHLVNSSTN